MGKGNRNSQKRNADNIKAIQADSKNSKNKKNTGKAVAAACIAFAILIVAVLVINVLAETGLFIRTTKALTLNGVEIDGAMLSFFYNDYLMSWYNNYSSYMSYMGVNFSASLKIQDFPKGGLASYILGEQYEGTWYDYFLDKVKENVKMYVTLCDAANKEGIKLDTEDYESIDKSISSILDSIKASKSSLSDWFGKGVNESDVRRCYEIITLANKYSEHKYEMLESALKGEEKADGTAIDDFINKNKADFYTAEYLSYEIKVSGKDITEQEYKDKIAEAKTKAEEIANAGNVENFLKLVEKYEIDSDIKKETETKKDDKTETETKDIEEQADEYRDTIEYETKSDLGAWIFKEEASEGDGKVLTEENTETVKAETTKTEGSTKAEGDASKKDEKKTYKVTTITAYLVTEASHLDKELTDNIGFVIGDNKADVEAFYKQFNESQNKTLDSFNDMAKEYYEKMHEGHDHSTSTKEPVFVYSKVEQASKDFFKSNYFSNKENDLDKWLKTDVQNGSVSRVFTVTVDKNTYYGFVYLSSRDEAQYYVDAFNGVISERYNNWYKNESGLKDIVYNQNALESINTIVLY